VNSGNQVTYCIYGIISFSIKCIDFIKEFNDLSYLAIYLGYYNIWKMIERKRG